LREEASEVGGVKRNARHAFVLHVRDADPVVGEAVADQLLDLADDLRIRGVERNPQSFGSAGANDVAVAEVEAQELGIFAGAERRAAHRAPAPRADRSVGAAGCSDVADGRAWQLEGACDLAVVESVAYESTDLLVDCCVMH
jgi:hypothetical protein